MPYLLSQAYPWQLQLRACAHTQEHKGSAGSGQHAVDMLSAVQAWAQRYALTCRDVADAFNRPGAAAAQQLDEALQLLEDLPWRFLADPGPSRGRAVRVLRRLQQAEADEALNDDGYHNSPSDAEPDKAAMGAPCRAWRHQPTKAQRLACRIQRNLDMGNITRAARALSSEP